MATPAIRCGECGSPVLYRDGWVHLRRAPHPAGPVFPEDPKLAGLPVQWEVREDGQLVRLDNS